MGINVLNNTSSQEVRLTTGPTNTIASGDVVVNAQSGYAQTASTALTIAQNNNTTAGASAIFSLAAYVTSYSGNTITSALSSIAQMSNGVLATAYTGNQVNDSSVSVKVAFRTLTGAAPYATATAQTTSYTCYLPIVKSIPNAGCVVSWGNSTAGKLQFAIYSNTGAVVKAATDVNAGSFSAGTTAYCNMGVISNGNIVFCYRIGTDMRYAIYDSLGNVVLAETTIEASSSPNGMCVTPQSNGNFVIAYNMSSTMKFAIYNAAGTLQGSLTSVSNGTAGQLSYGNQDYLCVELSNGNLVFQPADTSSYPRYAVYTSAGVLVTANNYIYNSSAYQTTSYLTGSATSAITATSSGFIVMNKGGANCYFVNYDFNGVALTAVRATQYTPSYSYSGTGNYSMYVLNLGNAGFAVYVGNYNGCGNTSLTLWCMDSSGITVGSAVSLTSGICYNSSIILTSDGSVAMQFINASNVYLGVYAVQKKSIMGVAQEAIAANSTGRIATNGTYTTNQNFASGGNFDGRTSTPVGSKGVVAGTTAVLYGMS